MGFDEIINDNQDVIKKVKKDYHDASTYLPFKALDINEIFDDSEMEEVARFLNEVEEAAKDNEKTAKAVEKYSKIAFKLLKLAKVAI